MNEGGRNRSASERLNAKMLDQMFVNMVGQGKKMKKSGVSMGLLLRQARFASLAYAGGHHSKALELQCQNGKARY